MRTLMMMMQTMMMMLLMMRTMMKMMMLTYELLWATSSVSDGVGRDCPPCQLFSQYGTYDDFDDNADDNADNDDFGHRLMMMMVVMDYTGLIRFDNDQNFEGLRVTLIDLYD